MKSCPCWSAQHIAEDVGVDRNDAWEEDERVLLQHSTHEIVVCWFSPSPPPPSSLLKWNKTATSFLIMHAFIWKASLCLTEDWRYSRSSYRFTFTLWICELKLFIIFLWIHVNSSLPFSVFLVSISCCMSLRRRRRTYIGCRRQKTRCWCWMMRQISHE